MTRSPAAPPLVHAAIDRRWSFGDAARLAVLVAVTLALYVRTAGFDFVNFDDGVYVSQNPHVLAGLSGANLAWASRAIVASNWHPLTLYVELTISSLFGPRPGPYHLFNALLHAANVAMVFLFLRRTTGRAWPATVAAALWGWHPLRVESVAWVSELKDVLCGTLTLLTLLAYRRYAAARSPARYAAVAGLLALAMLAKPMAVTVPAILLLLDVWPLGRPADVPFRRWWVDRLAEKLPLLALTLADSAYAFHTQSQVGSAGTLKLFPLGTRAANALVSIGHYLRQSFWPTGIAVFYPHPAMLGTTHPAAAVLAAAGIVLALTIAAALATRRLPAVTVGWLWFLGMLTPVIGIVQVGEQARADRYTYLPTIGLTFAVVWAVTAAVDRLRAPVRAAAVATGLAAAVALAAVTVCTVSYWRDTTALFTRADRATQDNYMAKVVLAEQALRAGDTAAALSLARRAVELTGDRTSSPRVALGQCLLATGRDADVRPALEQFEQAVRIRNIDAGAWLGIGRAIARQVDIYRAQGHPKADVDRRVRDAANAFRQSIRLEPDLPEAADRLGELLDANGRTDEALAAWGNLLQRQPNDPTANGDLAAALQRRGNTAAAVDRYRIAVQNGDARPATRARLAWLLAIDAGSTPDELADIEPLVKQACDDPDAGRQPFPWYAYSVVLARLDRWDAATAAGQTALALARSTGQADMARAIEGRLAAYQQGLVALPTASPATAPAAPAPGR